MWNILTIDLDTEYRTDQRLEGRVDKLLIAYNIPKCWLFLLNSFDFIFSLRDSETDQQ